MSDLTIEMLPAGHGDALFVEWGAANDRHLLLIDAGTRGTFKKVVGRLDASEVGDRIDLMVVTHVDADHIDGAIKLLGDGELGLHFGDVWFNGRHHLGPVVRGGRQGSILERVLIDQSLAWNKAFGGEAIVVRPDGALPVVRLASGLDLVLLSPTPERLAALAPKWDKVIEELAQDEAEREKVLLAQARKRYGVLRGGGRDVLGTDRSEANGSSIAFVAEYQGERWLFAGDAHADVLAAGLRRYGKERGEARVRLDGFKVAHHGSVNNISAELFETIACRRFLVSTNGAYFDHPDKACIDAIVAEADTPEFVFNYKTEHTSPWATPSDDYTARYGTIVTTGTPADRGRAEPPEPELAAVAEAEHVEEAMRKSPGVDSVPLAVRMFHGSLDRAEHAVLVGHYRATVLSGAAGYVDRRLQQGISHRLATGVFGGDLADSATVPGPTDGFLDCGAVVVGLGEYGELTAARLVETVRAALVRHAFDSMAFNAQADGTDVPPEVRTIGISSVLLGATGDQGMSIRASVAALVEGVLAANRTLDRATGPTLVRYGALDVYERGAAEAELAFAALRDNGEDSQNRDSVLRPRELETAGGSLANSLPVDTEERPWRRIRIDASHDEGGLAPEILGLEFSVGGHLARTGQLRHLVDRRHLERRLTQFAAEHDRWLQGADADQKPTGSLHTILFEMLFPNALKSDLMAAQDLHLEVSPATADVPWEMLAARDPQPGTGATLARSALALRAPMIRQLALSNIPSIERATHASALVIGNPPAEPRHPTLESAAQEAVAVRELLKHRRYGYQVEDFCFGAHATTDELLPVRIEDALLGGGHRIIHIAAHGVFDPDDPTRSGVVIGPDDLLTAQHIAQLPVVPDLVFLNCCHLGTVRHGFADASHFARQHLPGLASSLARQLIDGGVKAVVAAGWSVHDLAAKAFAEAFYGDMLHGEPFATAVHHARIAAFEAAPDSSTWGAYQCYGDAGYRLPDAPSSAQGPDSKPGTPRELQRRLETITDKAESAGSGSTGDLYASLREQLLALANLGDPIAKWLAAGQVAEMMARAFGAVGDLDNAIDWYQRGREADDGAMSLKGLEQLANLCDRRAAALVRIDQASDNDRLRADELLARSKTLIEVLQQIHPQGERLALFAGYNKRRATFKTGAHQRDLLQKASEGYRQSYTAETKNYALFNHLQLHAIRERLGGASTEAPLDRTLLDEELAKLQGQESNGRDFWDEVGVADGYLTRALLDSELAQNVDALIERYQRALRSRSLASERASTIDHIADLAHLHPTVEERDALLAIHGKLQSP